MALIRRNRHRHNKMWKISQLKTPVADQVVQIVKKRKRLQRKQKVGKSQDQTRELAKKSDKEEEKVEVTEDPLAYLKSNEASVVEPPFVMPPEFEGSVNWSESVNGGNEAWSRHGVWKIPCYTKQLNDDGTSSGNINFKDVNQPLVCLEVHTVSTEKMFNAEVPHDVISRFPASTSSKLDFGQMAVGQVEVAPIVVSNLHPKASILRMIQPPNTQGPFSIVNALRPLAEFGNLNGKSNRNLFVQFRPEKQLKYAEKIIVETDYGASTIRLIGQGVEPVLQVQPEDGKVDLGQVLAGDSASKKIVLKNCSVFPLTYSIVGRGAMPTNYNGTSVFSCVPEGAVIEPNAEQEVTVSIRPDHELAEPYSCIMMVRVPTTDEKKAVEKKLTLKGRCWQRQLYVRALQNVDDVKPGSKEAVDDIFSVPPELGVDTSEGREDIKTPARSHKIVLKFPKQSESAATQPKDNGGKGKGGNDGILLEKEIAIGATAINEPGRSGNGGTFEIGAPIGDSAGSEYFSFEPSKGSLSAGGEVIVKVKFTPPVEEQKSDDDPCVTIGRWNNLTYPCILKGGYIPEGIEAEEQVQILVILLTLINTFTNGLEQQWGDNDILSGKLNFEQKAFTSSSTPCRVQVDNSGRHGCYSPRGGVAAPTFDIFNSTGIQTFVEMSKSTLKTPYIVLLNTKEYTTQNLNILISTKNVAGIIVYQISKENGIPSALNFGIRSRWNPKGTGFLSNTIKVPLAFVSYHQQDSIKLLRSTAVWNAKHNPSGDESSMVVSMDLYSGTEKLNRKKCESFNFDNIARCLNIDGYSVWSTFDPRSDTVTSDVKKVFVSTGIDSTSLFVNRGIGGNSGTSGYVALLTAVDALATYFHQHPSQASTVKRELVFGLFNGEVQNQQGSKQFVNALINKCPENKKVKSLNGYDFPSCNLTGTSWEGFELPGYAAPLSMFDLNKNMEYVLSIDQVGMSSDNSMYIFSAEDDTSVTSDDNPIINMFKLLHQYGNTDTLNTVMPIKSGSLPTPLPNANENRNNNNLPPSPLDSFLNNAKALNFQNGNSKSAVLTGYKSTYINKYYHSLFDNIDNINRKDLYKFSTTLAKALYVMATTESLDKNDILLQAMKNIPTTLIVNETLLNDVINCTLISWDSPACKIANDFDIGSMPGNHISKYVTQDESNTYIHFAREFLSRVTCNEYDQLPNGCKNCDCVGNKCVKHSKAWYWKSSSVSENDILMEPIYESNAYEIKIYRQDPILLEWAFVGIGIVLLGLWFFCIKLFVKLKLKEF
eukprot:g8085.t1